MPSINKRFTCGVILSVPYLSLSGCPATQGPLIKGVLHGDLICREISTSQRILSWEDASLTIVLETRLRFLAPGDDQANLGEPNLLRNDWSHSALAVLARSSIDGRRKGCLGRMIFEPPRPMPSSQAGLS